MCYRESKDELDFFEAVQYCFRDHLDNGPYLNLMPVGKLRHFINRYTRDLDMAGHRESYHHQHDSVHQQLHQNMDHYHDHHWSYRDVLRKHGFFHETYGPFRVNGMKDRDNVWREHPSGLEINFHHFPDFNPLWGDHGDTLIWDPVKDELRIAKRGKTLKALCYRRKLGICKKCPGFYDGDRECFDAGDCIDGNCHCDEMFSGDYCEEGPPRHFQMLITVGTEDENDLDKNAEMYDFHTNTSCYIRNFPQPESFMSGEFVNGRAVVCGGELATFEDKACMFYDKHRHIWLPMQNFGNYGTSLTGSVVSPDGKQLWLTGGKPQSDHLDPHFSRASPLISVVLSEHNVFEKGPVLPVTVTAHCATNINECESAIIGGESKAGEGNRIFTYNWKTDVWREGPRIKNDNPLGQFDCDLIKDPETHHPVVVIGPANANSNTQIILWDTITDEITETEEEISSADNTFVTVTKLTEHSVVLAGIDNVGGTAASPTQIWTYSIKGGLKFLAENLSDKVQTTAFMAPRGYFKCLDEL